MELEFKHIAPYSPYKLECVVYDRQPKRVNPERAVLCGAYSDGSCIFHDLVESHVGFVRVAPILRPLSDYLGNKTGREVMDELNCSLDVVQEIWELTDGRKNLDQISVKTYNVMCENHIDFNRLLEAGLAVDINTIEPCKN